MFRHLTRAACALAVGIKNQVDTTQPLPLLSEPMVNRMCLQKCLPAVQAAGQECQMYVGDRIKRAVGFPQLTACCKPLRYKDFIISYDTKNRIPNWVYEHLQYSKFYKDDPCDRRVNVCPFKSAHSARKRRKRLLFQRYT
ncbi:endonuclease G, mitochondrial [Elysia marginata]|uniref:Endonuclease G, mitochondrial n=1 Tax=Elysia marginata TaxID=1093978 RepID=A0AAV4I7G0_9GAST|nr:endonuclease G, mitochondrial [Elysia marginata]